VKIAEKQPHLDTIEVSQCEQQIESSNPIYKKYLFLRMVEPRKKYFAPNASKVSPRVNNKFKEKR
jgi:hypothetical protein